ncbi:class I SAM-dependent methyltransferase [Teredinibacter waterburyi]|jgi:Predicted methyltransferase|uniref:class I SAM-dependent methyltransferase n=1 Tax=Teredinibacter waterburyi TaxID=1500538 RepID=UPI001FE89794|nr:protein N-lysine methyltransferase family protein [Teredinibacter waterburyi]
MFTPIDGIRTRYSTIEFTGMDIHVRTLRDNQQFADADGEADRLGISDAAWPLFGIVWDSSSVLAHLMLDFDIAGKRVLEVGCGIGLASLVLNKRCADISATDYHPEVAGFLAHNVTLNGGPAIPFTRTAWEDDITKMGQFDLIIGSDILYESAHSELLANFIDQHALANCEVVLVDPGRGHHARFSKAMVKLGYDHSQVKPEHTDYLTKPFKGQVLSYSRQSTAA